MRVCSQVVGLVFIIGGAVLQTAFSEYLAFFGATVNRAAIFIIVIGIVCLGVSFFGCCGAFKENHCMIITVIRCIFADLFIYSFRLEQENRQQYNMPDKQEQQG